MTHPGYFDGEAYKAIHPRRHWTMADGSMIATDNLIGWSRRCQCSKSPTFVGLEPNLLQHRCSECGQTYKPQYASVRIVPGDET